MFSTIRSKILMLVIGLMAASSITFTSVTTKSYQAETTSQYHRLADETAQSVTRIIDTEYNELLTYEIDAIKNQRLLMEDVGRSLLSMVDSFYVQQKSGALDEQRAKEHCLSRLNEYRYQKDNFFFVCDVDLIGLSHPQREMVGKKWTEFEDIKKKDALSLIQKIIKTKEKIFTVFMWPRPGDLKQVKQLGFFLYYPKWEWIIGTACQIGNIENKSLGKETRILSKIKKSLEQMSINEVGGILVFNSLGKVITHTSHLEHSDMNMTATQLNKAIHGHPGKTSNGFGNPIEYRYTNKAQREMVQTAYVKRYKYKDWYVASFIDNNELKKPVYAIAARQLILLLFVLSIGISFAVFISGKIASSLSKLAEYTRRLPAHGFKLDKNSKLETIISSAGNEETRQLTNAFLFMESELVKNIRNLEQHQKNLEGLVKIRTEELTDVNKNLKQEIRDREQLEEQREKIIKELQEALDKVKTLSGLLPICSDCKKIRDDKGCWNSLEGYIERHSDASFSHGMCSECSDILYGNQDWYIEMKEEDKDL